MLLRPYGREALIEAFGASPYGARRRATRLNLLLNIMFLALSAVNLAGVAVYSVLTCWRLRDEATIASGSSAGAHEFAEWPTGIVLRMVDRYGFDRLFSHQTPSLEIGIETGSASRAIFGATQFTLGSELDPRWTSQLPTNMQWKHKVIADANYLPIRSGILRCVALVHVLNNVEEIQGIMDECARVLAPGGAMVFSCFGPAMLDAGPFGAFVSTWLPQPVRKRVNAVLFSRHLQFQFDPSNVRAAVTKSGLAIDGEIGYWDRETSRIWATLHYGFYRRHGSFYLHVLRRLGIAWPLERFHGIVTRILQRDRFHRAVPPDEAGELIYRARRPAWSSQ